MIKWILLAVLTCASAFGDSRGFIWSDRAWAGSSVDWRAIGWSLLGYSVGIGTWLLAVKYLKQIGGIGVGAQATGWFILTIIGVSVASGEFFKWSALDKGLSLICIGSFAVLVLRTSG